MKTFKCLITIIDVSEVSQVTPYSEYMRATCWGEILRGDIYNNKSLHVWRKKRMLPQCSLQFFTALTLLKIGANNDSWCWLKE